MNYKYLYKLLSKAFDVRCFDGPDGDPGVGDPVILEKEEKEPEVTELYIGSDKVNPHQYPLKDFQRDGLSNEEIDNFITTAGPKIFLTPEGIRIKEEREAKEAKEREEKEGKEKTDEKPDEKDEDGKKPDEKQDDDKKGNEEPDKETEEFFKNTGLTQKEFNGLSKTAQENIVDKVFGNSESGEQNTTLKEENEKLKRDIEVMSKDPRIAARLEEISTGKSFLADPEKVVSPKVIQELDDLFADNKPDEAKKLLLKVATDLVSAERSVADNNAAREKHNKDTWKTLRSLGDLDPRLKIEEKDYSKIMGNAKHKEAAQYDKGTGDVIRWAQEKNIVHNLKNMTKEEIYAAYSTHKGWDKERDTKISEGSKKALLKKLREPRVATSLNQGKKAVDSTGLKGAEIDYDSLKEKVVNGDLKDFNRLQRAHASNPKVTEMLGQIFYNAELERGKRKKLE